ncbi:hypothetical protein ABZW30_30035 [Kitasatospora sp. NPDC004669]|uniref:hypothetical protein n=1 Tax=Kitasatospora sp. NPDC004669 TaxID=3154555 RepID=UPI00339DFEAC
MAAYTYTGPDDGRYYPTLGVAPTPGQSYDLDVDPGDGAWTPAPPPAATKTAPAATGKEVSADA